MPTVELLSNPEITDDVPQDMRDVLAYLKALTAMRGYEFTVKPAGRLFIFVEDDGAFVLCSNYEDGSDASVWRNGVWYRRSSTTGLEGVVLGGRLEVKAYWGYYFIQ